MVAAIGCRQDTAIALSVTCLKLVVSKLIQHNSCSFISFDVMSLGSHESRLAHPEIWISR